MLAFSRATCSATHRHPYQTIRQGHDGHHDRFGTLFILIIQVISTCQRSEPILSRHEWHITGLSNTPCAERTFLALPTDHTIRGAEFITCMHHDMPCQAFFHVSPQNTTIQKQAYNNYVCMCYSPPSRYTPLANTPNNRAYSKFVLRPIFQLLLIANDSPILGMTHGANVFVQPLSQLV